MTTIANPNQFQIVSQMAPEFCNAGVLVASGAAGSISYGSPTKAADAVNASPWTGAVVAMVDADGTTSQRFTGIAKSTSTDTAAAAGAVDIWMPLPGIKYAGKAKTASDANTAAKVQALFGKNVFFDLTSATWSIDVSATTAQANCVIIVDGDYQTSTIYWMYKPSGTFIDFSISA